MSESLIHMVLILRTLNDLEIFKNALPDCAVVKESVDAWPKRTLPSARAVTTEKITTKMTRPEVAAN